jgi:gliding motility-associated-like protein
MSGFTQIINISLIILLTSPVLYGQNLVNNSDFSKKSACPTTMSQLTYLSNWQMGTGTADYFDLCGTGYGGAPNHPWGYQWPHSDSGFVNFGYGESFKQTLSGTIKQGESVYYEYWTTRGENGQYAMYKFGIQFKNNGQLIHKETYNDTLFESTEWVPITGCFIAPSDINEIEIGYISGITGKVLVDATKTFNQAYGYVDDVYVIPGYQMDLGNDTSICNADSIVLDAQILGGAFLWNTNETTQTITVNGSTISSSDYSVEVSLGMCVWNDTIKISSLSPPIVNLGNDQIVCTGQAVTLDAGNAGSYYSWSNGSTSQAITTTNAGVYTVAVTNGSCTGFDTVVISNIPSISINLGNDTSICSGNSIVLNAANSGMTYNWSNGANTQSIYITDIGNSNASGNYWVNVTNGSCSGSDTIYVQFISNPTLNLGNDQSICQGQSLILDAGNSGATYLWSTSATSQSISVNSSGTYYVNVSQSGCSASDTVTITVNPSPAVDLGQDTGLCRQGSIVLDAGNPGATYLWSTGSSNQSLTIKDTMYIPAGYFSVQVSVGSCTDEDTIYVAFYEMPIVNMSDTAFCQNTILTLNANYSAATSYKWNTGDTTAVIDVSNQGQYSVIIDNNGCQGYDTVNTYMIPITPIDLGEDTILCENNTLNLDLGNAGTNYNWSTAETTSSIMVSNAGEYSVIVQNSYCYSYDTINVTYQTYPVVALNSDFSLCDGESASIGTSYSGALYNWSSGENTQQKTVSSSGIYWLIVDMNHCRDTDSVSVTVKPLPVFDLGKNRSICPNEEIIISPEVEANLFIWLPSQINSSSATITEPGTYSVTAIDSNACSYTDSITFDDYCPSVVYLPSAFSPNGDGKNDVFMAKGNNVYVFSMSIFDRWGNKIFSSYDLDKGWDGTTNGKPSPYDVYTWLIYYEGEKENNIGLTKQLTGSFTLFR